MSLSGKAILIIHSAISKGLRWLISVQIKGQITGDGGNSFYFTQRFSMSFCDQYSTIERREWKSGPLRKNIIDIAPYVRKESKYP